MTYKTHVAFSFTPVLAVQVLFNVGFSFVEAVFLIAVAVGSLLPDLDEEGSYIGKKFPVVSFVYAFFGIRHRGLTHYALFLFALTVIGMASIALLDIEKISMFFIFGLIFGYLMHLLGDMLTKGGIDNFFYPFSTTKAVLLPRGLRFYTGSNEELYFFIGAVLVNLICLFMIL